MQEVSTAESLREVLNEWRRAGDHIALVPTMGNLHAGHTSLMEIARQHAERVVVSVFVNPTQFSDDEDYEDYPRTLDRDKLQLKLAKADLLFAPDVDTMYPFGIDSATSVTVPTLTDEFCGSVRPGHFDGVTSVVSRLFSLVTPDVTVFGQKDFQQQLVIRRMVEDLSLPIRIVTGPTVRDEDGLALSSRNQYLSEDERAVAPVLYQALQNIVDEIEGGNRNYEKLEKKAASDLESAGFFPEYVSIRRAANLEVPDREQDKLVVLAAARLGAARLIDNLVFEI